MSKSGLFACINAINYKNSSYQYNKKDCTAYMLLLWFSHDQKCLGTLNEINEYLFSMPDKIVYDYLYRVIPQNNRRFLKWDKGSKKRITKVDEDNIKELMDVYGFSRYEAMSCYMLFVKKH